MNFTFAWIMDKFGYMPKIEIEVGKVDLKAQEVWPFPSKTEKPKSTGKKPAAKKTIVTKKPVAKKTTPKKAK